MGLMDVFSGLFGGGGAAPAAQPALAGVPGSQNLNPEVMQLLQQFGFGPPDDGEQKRRAIASALAKGGHALATSTQDFLPALTGAIGSGAVEYTGTREGQADNKQKHNMDILKQLFGLEKLDQTNDLKTLLADQKNDYNYRRLEELIRSNQVKEGQNDTKIGETGRHNLATEDIQGRNADTSAKNADTNVVRAGETNRHNLETEAQGRTRVKLEAEKTAADIKKAAAVTGTDGSKADNAYFTNRNRVEQAKVNKAKSLNLQDPTFSMLQPDEWKKAKAEYDTFAADLDAELAATGSPTKRRALGATENVETQALDKAGVPVTTKPAVAVPPAQPAAKTSVDDLGLPADIAAKVAKRITKNGKTYVKLTDGRVFEVQP